MVLARIVLEMDIQGVSILELGCGIGLPSHILNLRKANITATDVHPCAEEFMEQNASLNDSSKIPFVRTSWLDMDGVLGRYDVIIGSDLLYERNHVGQLSSFIERHSKSSNKVVIVDPGRFLHTRFSREMEKMGYSCQKFRPETNSYLDKPFKGMVLAYERVNTV